MRCQHSAIVFIGDCIFNPVMFAHKCQEGFLFLTKHVREREHYMSNRSTQMALQLTIAFCCYKVTIAFSGCHLRANTAQNKRGVIKLIC